MLGVCRRRPFPPKSSDSFFPRVPSTHHELPHRARHDPNELVTTRVERGGTRPSPGRAARPPRPSAAAVAVVWTLGGQSEEQGDRDEQTRRRSPGVTGERTGGRRPAAAGVR